MMMKVKVSSSTMVKPMIEKPRTSLWLSNLDFVVPECYHARTHYFYRSIGAPDFFNTAVLKAALSRALVEFYPMAGRLNYDDKHRIFINCNGQGALFMEAETDATLDDLGDFAPTPEITLSSQVDSSQGISTYPLFLVQVTRFKCGGVCVGIAIDHQLADGISGIHFMNTWSDMARGMEMKVPPFIDRRVVCAREPPHPEFTHVEYLPPPQLNTHKIINSQLSSAIFKLTRGQLNALKARCNGNEDEQYTTLRFSRGTCGVACARLVACGKIN